MTNQPTPAPDSDSRRALARNAVRPVLEAHGEWLRLSLREAVADAVLAAADMSGLPPDIAAHYDHAVNQAVTAKRRAEEAEAALERVRDAATLHRQGLLRTSELYAVIGAALDPKEADRG